MNDLSNLTQTFATTVAGLAAGTTTTFTTANTTQYCIKGKGYSKAAVTNSAAPTLDGTTGLAFRPIPIGSASVFVYSWNAAGAVVVSQGSIEPQDIAGNIVRAPQFPILPDNVAAFGYQVVRLAPATAAVPAVATWTFGTNNQAAVTGVTYARQDIFMLPDRPQSA
jgi:hypothetical protein